MSNKMKSDSKSSLRIMQIISVFTILVVLGANIQLFGYTQISEEVSQKKNIINTNENKIESNIENIQQEEIQVADEFERTAKITSRSAVNRINKTVEETQKETYITIDEIVISKDMDLTVRCGISKEDFKTLMNNLKTDTSGFFKENSDLIYELCEKYEINEIFFCGLIAAESGWNIASNHRNTNNYISMMSRGSLIHYSSKEEGLEAAAKLLHNKYLTPGGGCYYGKTIASVQKCFCPNSSTWVGLVYGCMKQIVK
jgi:uncharacterized protein YukE